MVSGSFLLEHAHDINELDAMASMLSLKAWTAQLHARSHSRVASLMTEICVRWTLHIPYRDDRSSLDDKGLCHRECLPVLGH